MLVGVWVGAIYNLAAGILLVNVYDGWSGASPWAWHQARAHPMGPGQTFGAGVVWVTLLAVVLFGLWQGRRGSRWRTPAGPEPSPRRAVEMSR